MEGQDVVEKVSPGRKSCGNCCSKLGGLICSNFGVCLLVLLYTVAGAFLFCTIEGGLLPLTFEEPSFQSVKTEDAIDSTVLPGKTQPVRETIQSLSKLTQETVERLWTITESLNILYRDNWTRVAERELSRFSESLLIRAKDEEHQIAASRDANAAKSHQWSFSGSFLYSLTVITTIGYGSVTPSTGLGRIVTILYALLGIPLMLLYLSSVGDLLSRCLKWIWSRVCRCRRKRPRSPAVPLVRSNHLSGPYTNLDSVKAGKWQHKDDDSDGGAIPVTLCLIIMVAYMCAGAAVFSYTHNWPFLHSIYFCFGALTTIGFGDLSPGVGARSEIAMQLSLLGAALYLLIGMALIATCFNLMQEQVTGRGGGFSRRLGGIINHGSHPQYHYDDT